MYYTATMESTLVKYFNLPKDDQIHIQTIINDIKTLNKDGLQVIKAFVSEFNEKEEEICDADIAEETRVLVSHNNSVVLFLDLIKDYLSKNRSESTKIKTLLVDLKYINHEYFIKYIFTGMMKKIIPLITKDEMIYTTSLFDNIKSFEDAIKISIKCVDTPIFRRTTNITQSVDKFFNSISRFDFTTIILAERVAIGIRTIWAYCPEFDSLIPELIIDVIKSSEYN